MSRATRDSHVTVVVLGNIAAVQIGRGQLRKAADSLRDALQVADAYAERAGRELPVSAYAHMNLGFLFLQWNDLQAAWDHLQEGVRLSRRWGEPLRLSGAYLQLADLLQARGDAQGALEAIHQAKQTAGDFSPWVTARVAMVEALICLRQGDTATALRWADSHSDAAPHYFGPDELWQANLVRAQIELARGRVDQALDLLRQVSQEAEGPAGRHALIGSLVLQAVALQAKPDQALAALERALFLAEPEGYVRIFVDAGAPMSRLLREAVAQGIAPQYARSLLAALDAEPKHARQPTALPQSAARPTSPLVEPLTERELQVLRLLATRLSSTEIAEQLFLSPNTVRSHMKNIYSKLDVHSRQRALDRASDLGLL
jgi:LuxR family maltose regulon positive regulatory protein